MGVDSNLHTFVDTFYLMIDNLPEIKHKHISIIGKLIFRKNHFDRP